MANLKSSTLNGNLAVSGTISLNGENVNNKITAATTAATTAQTAINNHTTNVSNPHSVTKSQVGLGNVANVLQYSASNPPPLSCNKCCW